MSDLVGLVLLAPATLEADRRLAPLRCHCGLADLCPQIRFRGAEQQLAFERGGIIRGERPTVNVGSCTALISHRPMTPADGNHLERVLAAATVALEHGRMLVELHLQLTELRTSRARIVDAADAERCRL